MSDLKIIEVDGKDTICRYVEVDSKEREKLLRRIEEAGYQVAEWQQEVARAQVELAKLQADLALLDLLKTELAATVIEPTEK